MVRYSRCSSRSRHCRHQEPAGRHGHRHRDVSKQYQGTHELPPNARESPNKGRRTRRKAGMGPAQQINCAISFLARHHALPVPPPPNVRSPVSARLSGNAGFHALATAGDRRHGTPVWTRTQDARRGRATKLSQLAWFNRARGWDYGYRQEEPYRFLPLDANSPKRSLDPVVAPQRMRQTYSGRVDVHVF